MGWWIAAAGLVVVMIYCAVVLSDEPDDCFTPSEDWDYADDDADDDAD